MWPEVLGLRPCPWILSERIFSATNLEWTNRYHKDTKGLYQNRPGNVFPQCAVRFARKTFAPSLSQRERERRGTTCRAHFPLSPILGERVRVRGVFKTCKVYFVTNPKAQRRGSLLEGDVLHTKVLEA